MAVFRVEKNRNYTVMSNYHLRDQSLSLKAKGLMSMILSLPEGWHYSTRGLAVICKEGVGAISAAVKELELAGYVKRNQLRGDHGRLADIEYVIYEQPRTDSPCTENPRTENPRTENPDTAEPDTDSPCSENPAGINIDIRNPKRIKTDISITDTSNPYQSCPAEPPGYDGMGYEEARELVKENIEYDCLASDPKADHERLDEVVDLIAETLCSQRNTIVIAGDEYPAQMVKDKLLASLSTTDAQKSSDMLHKCRYIDEITNSKGIRFRHRHTHFQLHDGAVHKEKMDLDVDVARLKIMKASHNSQQYKLEDNMLRFFPEQIEQNKGFIAGFEADMKTLAEHSHLVVTNCAPLRPPDSEPPLRSVAPPLPTEINVSAGTPTGFAGMEVKGDKLTDKDNAGAAILEAFKDAKGLEPVSIGSYRGFAMSLTVENFGKDFILTLKGQMTHRVTLGKDAKGNLTRIDNALNGMAERKQNVEDKLANLYVQMETAKAEIGKPFPQEDELRTKSARLAELNAELNIDDKTPMERLAEPETAIAKSARPSVLAQLKRPLPDKPTHKKENREMEVL